MKQGLLYMQTGRFLRFTIILFLFISGRVLAGGVDSRPGNLKTPSQRWRHLTSTNLAKVSDSYSGNLIFLLQENKVSLRKTLILLQSEH